VTAQAPPEWLLRWGPVQDFVRRVVAIPSPVYATSWWRSISHNAAVGGNAYSQHLLGLAADFPPTRGLVELARAQGLVAIDEGDHVHVQRYAAGTTNHIIDAVRQWLA